MPNSIKELKENFENVSYSFMDAEMQSILTPQDVLLGLKQGNKRFLEDNSINKDFHSQITGTSSAQFPHSIVLSCIDSRVPSEIIFDQGIGDLFNARIAGNFVNEDVLGSMEFACRIAGAKLILVMGHTSCGAVKGACDNAQLGNLTQMLSKLKFAVDLTPSVGGPDRTSKNSEFVNAVASTNVKLSIQQILDRSQVLKSMYDNKEIDIVGAMYHVETGEVQFFD